MEYRHLSGLYVSVFAKKPDPENAFGLNNVDCTAGGITSKHHRLLLVDVERNENIGPFKAEDAIADGIPVVYIDRRKDSGYGSIIVECSPTKSGIRMFGGNFVYTSDSRFPAKHPLPVHDRFE